jgi:hypothetical protein
LHGIRGNGGGEFMQYKNTSGPKKQNQKVEFLMEISKKPLAKKDNKAESWKNDIYGFECANWTCKC